MKLKPETLIKNLPPKLKELALKRAKEQHVLEEAALERTVNSAIMWSNTPEGNEFWSNIHYGQEFIWEENSCPFKEGNKVTNTEVGDAIFVRSKGQSLCYLECSKEKGWPRNASIPEDYIPKISDYYWVAELRQTTLRKEDKWAVKVSKDMEPAIVEFFTRVNKKINPAFTQGYYYHYPTHDGVNNAWNSLKPGYREISLEEFKRITKYSPQETTLKTAAMPEISSYAWSIALERPVYRETSAKDSIEKLPEPIIIKKSKKLWHLKEAI